jgi:topoisomerase-4 subunit B
MAENAKHNYDESKIKTLSSLEHIRLRTGMYIGRIGNGNNPDDGCYILLKEVVDNAIDEFIMGHGKGGRDHDRGHAPSACAISAAASPWARSWTAFPRSTPARNTTTTCFQFSVGLNGVGTKAVNALVKTFLVRSHRDGQFAEAAFKVGKLKKEKLGKTKEPDGTFIEFEPDPEIFKETQFRDRNSRRAPVAALQLPQHRVEADLQRQRRFQSRITA